MTQAVNVATVLVAILSGATMTLGVLSVFGSPGAQVTSVLAILTSVGVWVWLRARSGSRSPR
jgi:hypothetical protein